MLSDRCTGWYCCLKEAFLTLMAVSQYQNDLKCIEIPLYIAKVADLMTRIKHRGKSLRALSSGYQFLQRSFSARHLTVSYACQPTWAFQPLTESNSDLRLRGILVTFLKQSRLYVFSGEIGGNYKTSLPLRCEIL